MDEFYLLIFEISISRFCLRIITGSQWALLMTAPKGCSVSIQSLVIEKSLSDTLASYLTGNLRMRILSSWIVIAEPSCNASSI